MNSSVMKTGNTPEQRFIERVGAALDIMPESEGRAERVLAYVDATHARAPQHVPALEGRRPGSFRRPVESEMAGGP